MSQDGIGDTGWTDNANWDHSARLRDLYRRRCRKQAEEMTCAAQAADLLAPLVEKGDTVLDAGCGGGSFFHSLMDRNIPATYIGIDASPRLTAIGKEELPAFGLPAENLRTLRIEDLSGAAEHVVCLNVLTHLDNYPRPLERLLKVARKTLILRESLKEGAEYLYVRDEYLDPGHDIKVHINTYDIAALTAFITSYGWRVRRVEDRRTGGTPETVIGYPHYWTFLVAERDA